MDRFFCVIYMLIGGQTVYSGACRDPSQTGFKEYVKGKFRPGLVVRPALRPVCRGNGITDTLSRMAPQKVKNVLSDILGKERYYSSDENRFVMGTFTHRQ